MTERRNFTLTDDQYERLLNASRPVPYMIISGMEPATPQQNANDAWRAFGVELGFDWETVQKVGSDLRTFSAVPK